MVLLRPVSWQIPVQPCHISRKGCGDTSPCGTHPVAQPVAMLGTAGHHSSICIPAALHVNRTVSREPQDGMGVLCWVLRGTVSKLETCANGQICAQCALRAFTFKLLSKTELQLDPEGRTGIVQVLAGS